MASSLLLEGTVRNYSLVLLTLTSLLLLDLWSSLQSSGSLYRVNSLCLQDINSLCRCQPTLYVFKTATLCVVDVSVNINRCHLFSHVAFVEGLSWSSSLFYLLVARPAGAHHLVRCLRGSCVNGALPLDLFPTHPRNTLGVIACWSTLGEPSLCKYIGQTFLWCFASWYFEV